MIDCVCAWNSNQFIKRRLMERIGLFMNKNYEYLSVEHANYIKELIKKAADKDINYDIFGAKSHKYHLNETVSLEWV